MDPVLPSQAHEITPKINPQAAVSGLSNDHEVSPEDGTASVDVIRDIDNKLGKSGDMNVPERYSISTAHPTEAEDFSLYANELDDKCPISDIESLEGLRDNPEDPRCTHLSQSLPDQNGVLYDDKNSTSAYAAGGVPEELVKAAANMLGNIEPGYFMKMLEVASSLNDKGPSFDTVGEGSNSGMKIPEMTHEMAKIKFAGVSNEITPEDFQKMISLLYTNGMPSPRVIENSPRSENISGSSVAAGSSETRNPNAGENKSSVILSDSGMGQSRLSIPIPDLSKANEVSHEDDIATDIIRNTSSVLRKDTGDANAPQRIEEEALQTMATYGNSNSSSIVAAQPVEFGQCSQSANESYPDTPKSECFQSLGGNVEASRLSQNDVFNCEPDSLAALGTGGISAEIVKTATDMISNSEPEELQKMLEVAFSLNVKGPIFNTIGSPSGLGLDFPDISLEMVKMASDRVSKMTTEELRRMLEVAPLVNMNVIFSPRPPSGCSTQRSKSCSEMSILEESPALGKSGSEKILSSGSRLNSKMSQSSSSLSTQMDGFPENMRHLTNDPATQQMLTYMKDMSPKMMTSMSEQLGLKLPCGEAMEAQQTMSTVSEDDLDAMTLQDESVQGGPETMEKTTIWFIGKAGLNLAICMMLLAFIFHKLGYIRG